MNTETVPFELRAIGAEEVGQLLGCSPRTVLEIHACKPAFPTRVSLRPATWVAGEVLQYRDKFRAGLPARRRRPGSRKAVTSDRDDQ